MELVETTANAIVMLDTRRLIVASNCARMVAQVMARVMATERVFATLAMRVMHAIS